MRTRDQQASHPDIKQFQTRVKMNATGELEIIPQAIEPSYDYPNVHAVRVWKVGGFLWYSGMVAGSMFTQIEGDCTNGQPQANRGVCLSAAASLRFNVTCQRARFEGFGLVWSKTGQKKALKWPTTKKLQQIGPYANIDVPFAYHLRQGGAQQCNIFGYCSGICNGVLGYSSDVFSNAGVKHPRRRFQKVFLPSAMVATGYPLNGYRSSDAVGNR